MLTGVAHNDGHELVPSAHCVHRFRQRLPLGAPGGAAAIDALLDVLREADLMAWPPAWAVSDRPAELWAVNGDLAFPLAPAGPPGRWVAVTCLRRS